MATGDLKIDRINSAYSQMRISGITVQPSAEDNKRQAKRACTAKNFQRDNNTHTKKMKNKEIYHLPNDKLNTVGTADCEAKPVKKAYIAGPKPIQKRARK